MGRSSDMPNMDSEPGKSKWLPKGNLEEISHKNNSNYHEGLTQRLFLWVHPCVYLHKLYSLFLILLLDKYFVLLLFVFVGILFLQSRRAKALSLTTGLAARIWCSHFWELTSISGWGTEALLQKGTAGQGHLRPRECMELAATCSWDLILLLLLLLSHFSHVWLLWPHKWQPTRLPRPWNSPGKSTGVGCHHLLWANSA